MAREAGRDSAPRHDIFISYSSKDRDRIRPLVDLFEKQGWSVWWDHDIPPGRRWDEVIEEAIGASSCVVVVWSESSVQSEWVANEAALGKDRGALIPVLIDDVRIPLEFRRVQAARLFAGDGSAEHPEVVKLFDAVRRALSGARVVAASPPETESPLARSAAGPARRPSPQKLALAAGLAVAAAVAGYLALGFSRFDVTDVYQPLIQRHQAHFGEALGGAQLSSVVVQDYTHGLMLWADLHPDRVYVCMHDEDGDEIDEEVWSVYRDIETPAEGEMETYLETLTDERKRFFNPQGGFLRQWRARGLEESLGWPSSKEWKNDRGAVQRFERGVIVGLFPFYEKTTRTYEGEPLFAYILEGDGKGSWDHESVGRR